MSFSYPIVRFVAKKDQTRSAPLRNYLPLVSGEYDVNWYVSETTEFFNDKLKDGKIKQSKNCQRSEILNETDYICCYIIIIIILFLASSSHQR